MCSKQLSSSLQKRSASLATKFSSNMADRSGVVTHGDYTVIMERGRQWVEPVCHRPPPALHVWTNSSRFLGSMLFAIYSESALTRGFLSSGIYQPTSFLLRKASSGQKSLRRGWTRSSQCDTRLVCVRLQSAVQSFWCSSAFFVLTFMAS